MTLTAYILLMVVSVLINPSTKEEATKAKVLELAKTSLEQYLDMDVYAFNLVVKWIPKSILKAGPENIHSVTISGNVEEYTRFAVRYQTKAGRKTSDIQLKVESSMLVVVAKHRILNTQSLHPDLFEFQWKPVKLGRDRFITTFDELEGKSIRRSLLPDQPIRMNDISNPILISPGQEIIMQYHQGSILLGLKCESRQSGSMDEEIKIYCPETRKKYTAKVISAEKTTWQKTN